MSEKMLKIPRWFWFLICDYFIKNERSEINEKIIKEYLEEKLTSMIKREEYIKKLNRRD